MAKAWPIGTGSRPRRLGFPGAAGPGGRWRGGSRASARLVLGRGRGGAVLRREPEAAPVGPPSRCPRAAWGTGAHAVPGLPPGGRARSARSPASSRGAAEAWAPPLAPGARAIASRPEDEAWGPKAEFYKIKQFPAPEGDRGDLRRAAGRGLCQEAGPAFRRPGLWGREPAAGAGAGRAEGAAHCIPWKGTC